MSTWTLLHPLKPQRHIQQLRKSARLHARFSSRWHKHEGRWVPKEWRCDTGDEDLVSFEEMNSSKRGGEYLYASYVYACMLLKEVLKMYERIEGGATDS